ncbi:putative callose synthase 6 isoform X2 [Humulus lupulus]|nr:putative callose synthase 6 isoform X2 [Humulus lupulus]XP_062112105.1 putative callose synthase 6 isoform X2 [Humulus lupulus]XP_062112106.1 putative callose synthase 6 isoform X2 [Humulus lupulus]XP_062112107.1 putative callose synthase 6 isoform X2 [Humulus lupulus]
MEHLILLLANIHIRKANKQSVLKSEDVVVDELMRKFFKNYTNWCKFLPRKSNIRELMEISCIIISDSQLRNAWKFMEFMVAIFLNHLALDGFLSDKNKKVRAKTESTNHEYGEREATRTCLACPTALVGGLFENGYRKCRKERCLPFFLIIKKIMTRRPLVLQLDKTNEGAEKYAEFLHLCKRRFTDFGIDVQFLSYIIILPKLEKRAGN